MKKLAIITVNYNNKIDTLEFLESLKKLDTKGLETNIIVVDNGSTDGSVSLIKKKLPKITILQTGINKGFAGGFNHGITYALIWGADYLLIANNDLVLRDKSIAKKLIETISKDKKIGIVSPKILFAPGYEFYKDRYKEKDKGFIIWYAGSWFDWNNIYSIHRGIDQVDIGQFDKVEETELASGACFLTQREVLEKVGMFDQSMFAYLEDTDFSVRLKRAGFKLHYDGRTSIYHKVSRTVGIGSSITDYFHARNRLIFGMRYASDKTKFALLREALKFFLFGRDAQRRGVWDFLIGKRGGITEITQVSDKIEYPYKLSIVIVNYNTAILVKKLLESIFNNNSGVEKQKTEVVLLDNGRLDPCDGFIDRFPKVKYLQNAENAGFSGGYNKTISYTAGEYILMLNSDIEVLEDGLSEITNWADHFKGEAVVGGRLYFPDMTNQDSAFHLPTVWGAFKEYFLAQFGSYFMYLPSIGKPVQVDGLVMACFLIPRKILNKVGFLDEGTFIFFEDIEYCRRLQRLGISLYFCPSAQFIHHHGASTKKIGLKANEFLEKGALHYHGKLYYWLLYGVLWLGQKFGRVQTPVSRS